MEVNELEKILREQTDASLAIAESNRLVAEECRKKSEEYTKQVIELERERISRDKETESRKEQTAAIERSNHLIQERNQKLEIVLDIFQRMFIDEKTIESLIHQQSDKINDVNATLIKIATILQLQATRVIEALVVDDKTKEEYHRLLATIESGLRRGDAKVEFKSERDMNLKSRDIGG